jgi:hypothetical protein
MDFKQGGVLGDGEGSGSRDQEKERVNVISEHERCKRTERWTISFYLSNLWQKDGISRDRVGERG